MLCYVDLRFEGCIKDADKTESGFEAFTCILAQVSVLLSSAYCSGIQTQSSIYSQSTANNKIQFHHLTRQNMYRHELFLLFLKEFLICMWNSTVLYDTTKQNPT